MAMPSSKTIVLTKIPAIAPTDSSACTEGRKQYMYTKAEHLYSLYTSMTTGTSYYLVVLGQSPKQNGRPIASKGKSRNLL